MLIETTEHLNSNKHNLDMHHVQTTLTWRLPLSEFWHLPLGGRKIEALDRILSLRVSSLKQYKIHINKTLNAYSEVHWSV